MLARAPVGYGLHCKFSDRLFFSSCGQAASAALYLVARTLFALIPATKHTSAVVAHVWSARAGSRNNLKRTACVRVREVQHLLIIFTTEFISPEPTNLSHELEW